MNLLFTLDKNYFPQLQVLLTSLKINNPGEHFCIWLLHNKLPEDMLETLERWCDAGGHQFHPIQVADEVFHIVEGGVVVVMMMLVAVFMFMLVMMMAMVMVQALLPLSVDHHVHMGAGDAAGLGGDGVELHPRQTHVVEGVQEFLPVGEQLIQSGGEHVPGGSHVTL